MSFIDPEIKSVLDMRLAKGELDVAEYQSLIKTMMQDVGDKSSTPTKPATPPFIHPGALRHAWRKFSGWECRLHSRYGSNPDVKNRLLWLDNVLDYYVTDEYLIVLSSSPDTKVKRIADTVATFGAMGALAGGLLVSIPALLVGNAYEKLFGENNQFNTEALLTIFNSGYAIYSKKSDLTFQSFAIKSDRFNFAYVKVAIIGRFKNAILGDVDLCFLFGDGPKLLLETNTNVAKLLRAAGCFVNEHPETLKSENQLNSYLPPEFPRPVPVIEMMCPKCSHYREQKGWCKVGFTGRMSGDYKLDSKPSNEKLPCRIPAKASLTWDHYFFLKEPNREYLYPTDCPLFTRK